MKDIKLPQAILGSAALLGTLGALCFCLSKGIDPMPVVLFGGGALAAFGFGTVSAQQREIKEQTNGTSTAQQLTIRQLAAAVAMAQPTPEMRAIVAQMALPPALEPVSAVPALNVEHRE